MSIRCALFALAVVVAAPPALGQTTPEWAAPMEVEAAPAPSAMGPGPPPPPPAPPAVPGVPIDGGLGLLLLAGAGYGVHRLRRR